MGNMCSLSAHCYDSKGNKVESRLYNDLLHFTDNNRKITNEYYGLGTDKSFLDQVRDKANFDENGEITLPSLIELGELDIEESKIIQSLNKEIGSGEYEYQDAIVTLQNFNRSHNFRNSYMATIRSTKNGKYILEIVKRTPKNEETLTNEIKNRSIQDRIKYYLEEAGVEIGTIEDDERAEGRYSTENAERTARGLYQLIQVAKGKPVKDEVLAEEAGHFAIAALGKNPLVLRLHNLLDNEDIQRQILGDEYDSKELGNDPARELSGYLVGKAIVNDLDKRNPVYNLVKRLLDNAKRLIAKVKGDEMQLAILEAKNIAEQIAKGFMSPHFTGHISEALSVRETLYHSTRYMNTDIFKDIYNTLKLQTLSIKNISKSYMRSFKQIEDMVGLQQSTTFSDLTALEGIANLVSVLIDQATQEIPGYLDNIEITDSLSFQETFKANAEKIRVVRTFLNNAYAILNLISNHSHDLLGYQDKIIIKDQFGNDISLYLPKLVSDLERLLSPIMRELMHKEALIFTKFLEIGYGKKYIHRSARVLFNWRGFSNKYKNEPLLKLAEDKVISIEECLHHLDSDISLYDAHFASMSNNSDIIGQIADKIMKQGIKTANDNTIQAWDTLRGFKDRLKKIGFSNTDIICERSNKTGALTGNFISRYNWGDYENDWLEFRKECDKEFKDKYPNLDTLNDVQKGLLWEAFFKPKIKEFHEGAPGKRAHSQPDKTTGKWIPSKDYINDDYLKLEKEKPELIKWLKDLKDFKESYDKLLPAGSIPLHRLPQFKGTFSNKVRNRNLTEDSGLLKNIGYTLRDAIIDTFCEDSEDTEYGSDLTYNSIEEDLFGSAFTYEREKLDRLPLFGINKLKDPNQLSTDVFRSLLAYAAMCNTYNAKKHTVDAFEIGKNVLENRKVEGLKTEKDRYERSRAFTRYTKFLRKQVYSIHTSKIYIGKRILVNKIVNFINAFGGKYFLGGNVAGGIVNTLTGNIEIFKEAISGEFFDIKDLINAEKIYWSDVVPTLMNIGNIYKEDKLSAFIRHFDVLNDNQDIFRNFTTRKTWVENAFTGSLMWPYKAGEHYMQTISYIAVAERTKLYQVNGKEVSLYDAYQVHKNSEDVNTFSLRGIYLKNKNDINKYKMLTSIINKLNSPLFTINDLSSDEYDYIKLNYTDLSDTKKIINNLKEEVNTLIWNKDDEIEFGNKVREINNRLHGIYNEQDSVALQQTIIGNALLSLRKYALGMLERRFGSNKYSVILGDETEGSLRSSAKILVMAASNIFTKKENRNITKGLNIFLRGLLLPFGDGAKEVLIKEGFSVNQYRNSRRNFGDFLFIGLLVLLKMLSAKDPDDEEDQYSPFKNTDESTLLGLTYYFSNRLLREQMAFNTFRGAREEYTSLFNFTPAGVSALMDMADIAEGLIFGPFADYDNSEYYYQSSKPGAYDEYDLKAKKKLERRFPYWRSKYVFTNPYDAADAFEYGRKVRK